MYRSIKSSELATMSKKERKTAFNRLVRAALHEPNVGIAAVQTQVRQFELRYELSSEEMEQEVAAGKMRETAEIARWRFLLRVLDPNA